MPENKDAYQHHLANRNVISLKAAQERVKEFGSASVADSWVLLQRPNGEVDPVDATQLQRYLDLGWTEPPVEEEAPAVEKAEVKAEPAPAPAPKTTTK